MNTKKVVDWIKIKNYKDNSRNLSALVGLKRTNTILGRLISQIILYMRNGRQKYSKYVTEF